MGERGLRRTSEPAALAVSVSDCQSWGNISGDSTYLTLAIKGVTDIAEKYLKQGLITQTWKMSLDRWPGGARDWWDTWHAVRTDQRAVYLELPYSPLQSITSVTTYDTDDASTSVTVADYFITDTNAMPGRLCLRSGQPWPTDTRNMVRIEIVYVTGYGNADTDVPEGIRTALMQAVVWMYEHRGDCDAGSAFVKSGAALALRAYKIMDVN
jgi:uncharacterized phiE125 gp8 family phage protein